MVDAAREQAWLFRMDASHAAEGHKRRDGTVRRLVSLSEDGRPELSDAAGALHGFFDQKAQGRKVRERGIKIPFQAFLFGDATVLPPWTDDDLPPGIPLPVVVPIHVYA